MIGVAALRSLDEGPLPNAEMISAQLNHLQTLRRKNAHGRIVATDLQLHRSSLPNFGSAAFINPYYDTATRYRKSSARSLCSHPIR